jgi:hypothetical protein
MVLQTHREPALAGSEAVGSYDTRIRPHGCIIRYVLHELLQGVAAMAGQL